MKRHADARPRQPAASAEHLAGVHDDEVIALAKDIVYTHHERWDGSGYPRGLRGTAIPLAGRLVAVVDVYDALVEARAYKAAAAAGPGPRHHRRRAAARTSTPTSSTRSCAASSSCEVRPSALATPLRPA